MPSTPSPDFTPNPILPDPRNEAIQIWVGDRLWSRHEARVSVFDSAVQGGDSVWEGLRIYDGKIFQLDAHLDRMFASAKALAFANVPTRDYVKTAIFETLKTNGMRDQSHIRLTLTRGKKVTSGMSPTNNQYGCTLIVLAEWKAPVYDNEGGIRLITSAIRRNGPQFLDSKIHHANLLNNILAKIQANFARVDDAIMLDDSGFVSETNATNLFLVRGGAVLTPHADSCLPGITRRVVIELCHKHDIPMVERNLSLTEVYTADECFTTGTMGELSPVVEVDGRIIGSGAIGTMTSRLQDIFAAKTEVEGEPLPF
jgi:protein-lysine N-methyltransferase EEF2KMT